MNKAKEFLKNKGILNIEWDTDEGGEFTLAELLDEYAAEVSREKLRDAFEQGYDHHNDPNKYYGFDEWMSKQQNKER